MKNIPRSIWGKKLPINNRKERMRIYLAESIIFMIAMTIFDVLALFVVKNKATFKFFDNYLVNYILSVLITSLILFIISYVFDFIVSEISVRKCQK